MDGTAERGKKHSKWGSRKHKKKDVRDKETVAHHVDVATSDKDTWRLGKSSSGCFVEPLTDEGQPSNTISEGPPSKLMVPAPVSTAIPVTTIEQANPASQYPPRSPSVAMSPLTEGVSSSRELSPLPPLARSEEAELHDPPTRRHRGRRLFGKLTRSLSKNRSLPPSPDRMSASSQGGIPKRGSKDKSERSSSQPPSPERSASHSHRRWWFSRSSSQARSMPTTPDKQAADVAKSFNQDRGDPTSPVSWLPTSKDSWGGSANDLSTEAGESGGFARSPQGSELAARGPPWSAPTTPQGRGFSQWSVLSTPQGIGSPPSSGPSTPSVSREPQWMSLGSPPVADVSDWKSDASLETPPKAPSRSIPRYGEATESPVGSDWNGSTGEAWLSTPNSLSSSPRGLGEDLAVSEGVPSVPGLQTAPSLDAGFGGGSLSLENHPLTKTPSKDGVFEADRFEELVEPSPVSVLRVSAQQGRIPQYTEEPLATVEEAPVAEAVEAFDFAPGPDNTPPRAKGDGREKDPRAVFLKEDALVSDWGASKTMGMGGKEGAALERSPSFGASGPASERPDVGVEDREGLLLGNAEPLDLEPLESEPLMEDEEGAAEEGVSLDAEQAAGALVNESQPSEGSMDVVEREALSAVEGVPVANVAETEESEGAEAASKAPRVSAGIVDLVSYFESEAFKKPDNPYAGQKGTLSRTTTTDVAPGEAVAETAPSLVATEPVSFVGEGGAKGEESTDEARFEQLKLGSLLDETGSLSGIRTASHRGPSALEKLLASTEGASGATAKASNAGPTEAGVLIQGVYPDGGFERSADSALSRSENKTGELGAALEPTPEPDAIPEALGLNSAESETSKERGGMAETTKEGSEEPQATEERSGVAEAIDEQSPLPVSTQAGSAEPEWREERISVPEVTKEGSTVFEIIEEQGVPEPTGKWSGITESTEEPGAASEPTEEVEAGPEAEGERSAAPRGLDALPEAAEERSAVPETEEDSLTKIPGYAEVPAVESVLEEPNGELTQETAFETPPLPAAESQPEEWRTGQAGKLESAEGLPALLSEPPQVGKTDGLKPLPEDAPLGVDLSETGASSASLSPVDEMPAVPLGSPLVNGSNAPLEENEEEGLEKLVKSSGFGSKEVGRSLASEQQSQAIQQLAFDGGDAVEGKKQTSGTEAGNQEAAQTDGNFAVGRAHGQGLGLEESTEEKESVNVGVNEIKEPSEVESRDESAKEEEQQFEQSVKKGIASTPVEKTGTDGRTGSHQKPSKPETEKSEEVARTGGAKSINEPSPVSVVGDTSGELDSPVDSAMPEGSSPKQGAKAPLQDSQQGRIDEPEEDVESDAATRQLAHPTDVTDDASSGAVRVPEQTKGDVSESDRENEESVSETDPLPPRQHDIIQPRPKPPPPHPAVQILLVSGILAKAAVKTSVGLTYLTAKQFGVLAVGTTNGVIDDVKGVAGSLFGYAGRMVGLGKSERL